MPQSDSSQALGSPNALIVAVLKRGGIFGSIGVCGLFLAGVGELGEGLGLFHLPAGVTSGLVLIGWSLVGLCILSGTWHSNRATQMIATSQAENKIENPHLTASSADPAIQSAIDQITSSDANKAAQAARHTPPTGMPRTV